ncbi:MAG: aldehyde dehydrogenase (NADP(+)) [Chloroflexi bacterium]|nr:aldehyde dehydrogenase (NADP(+)) [Chloroflexota bacterium]
MTQLIAGISSHEGTQTFTSINPRTKQPGTTLFYDATPSEIDRAVRAAAEAFEETRFYPAEKLAGFLDVVADEIEALGDTLLETADWETGLGLPRLQGERGRTTGQLRKFAALLREGSYVDAIIDTATENNPDVRRMLFPIGPVGVFSASNFPFAFAVAGGDTASAFAAGCPVIVKGHPSHPATSQLFAEAIAAAVEKCGFPAGFFSLIQGNSIDVGQTLVKHPLIEVIGFTGSLRGGRAIFDTAAARPKPIPVFAEMGSVNPVIFMPEALKNRREELAASLVNSVTLGSGQFCTNPGLLFVVDNQEGRQFIQEVTELMSAAEPCVLLNAQIENGLAKAVENTRQHASIELLTGGMVEVDEYYTYASTVMHTTSENFRNDTHLQVEHFGPVTMFVTCNSLDDMRETVSTLDGNLTAAIHAEASEMKAAHTLFAVLREKVGRLIWNGFPTGVAVVPAMQHGGPYPATTAPHTTSVGMVAIQRFMRPVAFQNMPNDLLPDALKNENPLHIWRLVNWERTCEAI